MSTPAPELSPGTALDGYTLGAKVRTRSGAATYAAKDSSGRDVHVTVYADACFPSTLVRERSLRELRQLQAVDAPQLAKVLDSGKFGTAGVYEVGEPIVGDALAQAGQLDRAEVSTIMNAIGEALLAAQKVGVIHRNLGAHVVFSTSAGVKVLGFTVGEPQGGAAFGPIDAIAPEQVTGKVVDQRTLIYNLAAIAHQLLTGRPLFDGSVEQKLDLHLNAEPSGIDASLQRALSKDPRMRPMMLKQFVGELAKLGGGVAAPAAASPIASKPSNRGWTMFMDAQAPAEPAPAPAASQPAVAPVPAPSVPMPSMPSMPSPAVSAPAPAQPAAAAKPSVRGWTMFMEADAGGAAEPAAPTPAPAPVAAPAMTAPTPAPVMAPTPAVHAPVHAPAPVPAPAPAAAAKPSVRGWTMFMEAEGGEQPAAAAPASAPTPAPAAVPMPSPAMPVVAPAPAAPAAAAEPTKRGWTMFMEADQPADPASAPVVAPAPVIPAPASVAPAPVAAEAKPTMRGWTMFMEGDAGGAAPAEAPATAPAPTPAPTPGETSTAPSTRGWTMFMEAQLPAGTAGAEAPAAQVAPAPAPVPAPAGNVGSDAKGWTIFVERPAGIPAPSEPEDATAPPAAAAPAPAPAGQSFDDVAVSSRSTVAEEAPARPAQAVANRTMVMHEAPVIAPPTETRPVPRPSEVPMVHDEPKSKTGLMVGIGLVVIVIVILIAVFGP